MAAPAPINDPRAPVLLFEHRTRGGAVLAEARLHVEATLNSLSLQMIDLLTHALDGWAARPEVAAVLLTGSGDRAFCAGGDIQALYHAMVANHQRGEVVDDYPFQFFEREYRLDYRIHTYPKPTVALGHGIVMGGGLGILSGSRYRIVTERSRVAMPEVTIGLFPDAGQTWLLRNMPQHHATFVGVTGSHMNAADAVAVGLATHSVPAEGRDAVRSALLDVAWGSHPDAAVAAALDALPEASLPEPQLSAVPETVDPRQPFAEVVAAVRGLRGASDWVDRGIDTLGRGCPTTVGIVVEQLKRAPSLTLADAFRMELTIATHCAENHDFAEGVRALLIEKDNAPRWQFDDLDSLPEAYVASHFVEPWATNPLDDLE